MGIFSYKTGYVSESMIDMDSVDTQYCFEENAMDSAYRIVAENTANWNSIMEAIGIDELIVYESTGSEIVYEAGTISGIFTKIKEFFKKLLEKIKGIFAKFMTVLNSWTKSEKQFVKKYKMDLLKADMKDFEFKGYKFTLDKVDITLLGNSTSSDVREEGKKAGLDKLTDLLKRLPNSHKGNGQYDSTNKNTAKEKFNDAPADLEKDEYDEATKKLRESKDDILDGYRGGFFNDKSGTKIDESDFSSELFEALRNGESEKELLDDKDIDITECMRNLESFQKDVSDAEKAYKYYTKGISDCLKEIDDYSKALGKELTSDDSTADKLKAAKISFITQIYSIGQQMKSISTLVYGAYIQAIKDRNRQNKQICVKALTRRKPKNESASYYEEGGSMLAGVSLK